MNKQKYREVIRKHALTEFKLDITISARVGDEHPGWAENNVAAVVPGALEREGIMVDKCEVKVRY